MVSSDFEKGYKASCDAREFVKEANEQGMPMHEIAQELVPMVTAPVGCDQDEFNRGFLSLYDPAQ